MVIKLVHCDYCEASLVGIAIICNTLDTMWSFNNRKRRYLTSKAVFVIYIPNLEDFVRSKRLRMFLYNIVYA